MVGAEEEMAERGVGLISLGPGLRPLGQSGLRWLRVAPLVAPPPLGRVCAQDVARWG